MRELHNELDTYLVLKSVGLANQVAFRHYIYQ